MNRRHALVSIATTVAAAGCLGASPSSSSVDSAQRSSNQTTTTTEWGNATNATNRTRMNETYDADECTTPKSTATATETPSETSSTPETSSTDADLPDSPFEGMRSEPAATYVVGKQSSTTTSSDGAHVVQVWNDGPDARDVSVVITGQKTGTQFDERVDIAAGDHLNFVFETPDAYRVEVSGKGFSSASSVDREWGECSTSMTTIRLRENGTEMRTTSQSGTC